MYIHELVDRHGFHWNTERLADLLAEVLGAKVSANAAWRHAP